MLFVALLTKVWIKTIYYVLFFLSEQLDQINEIEIETERQFGASCNSYPFLIMDYMIFFYKQFLSDFIYYK